MIKGEASEAECLSNAARVMQLVRIQVSLEPVLSTTSQWPVPWKRHSVVPEGSGRPSGPSALWQSLEVACPAHTASQGQTFPSSTLGESRTGNRSLNPCSSPGTGGGHKVRLMAGSWPWSGTSVCSGLLCVRVVKQTASLDSKRLPRPLQTNWFSIPGPLMIEGYVHGLKHSW